MRILCIGDIHLGRIASRVPESLQKACSPTEALRRAVDLAIAEEVDAVILAGDVVDRDNRFFEAYGPLSESARKLEKHRIPLLGVAGNHDVEVLPRLAREVPGFHLLGKGGKWSFHDLKSRRDPSFMLRVWGWSFPRREVWEDPLGSFRPHLAAQPGPSESAPAFAPPQSSRKPGGVAPGGGRFDEVAPAGSGGEASSGAPAEKSEAASSLHRETARDDFDRRILPALARKKILDSPARQEAYIERFRDRAKTAVPRTQGTGSAESLSRQNRPSELSADALVQDLPWIGVLHTQIDGKGTPYAPTELSRLKSSAARAWLLGHVHKPSISQDSPVGYLGNLSPLNPTETGMRGPWLMEVSKAGALKLKQLPLAGLRWEELEVPFDENTQNRSLEAVILDLIRQRRELLAAELGDAAALGFRLVFTGRAREVAALRKTIAALPFNELKVHEGGVTTFVDSRYRFEVKEAIDLKELASHSHPLGLMAKQILLLEAGDEQVRGLLEQARRRLEQVGDRRPFRGWKSPELDDDELRSRLIAQGHRVLEMLLEERRMNE